MKVLFTLIAFVFALSACTQEVPDEIAPAKTAAIESMVPAPIPPSSAPVAMPSFDCAKAASETEKMVCDDAELAGLDKRLAEFYAVELAKPDADANLAAMQRGWIKGRDECWKADDRRRCVQEAYLTRLVELQINGGEVTVPTPVELACDDNSKPFSMVYYNELDPQAAVITWGDDQAIIFPQMSGSGSKYGRTGIEFWEHQGEVTVDFYGNKLKCKVVLSKN